MAAANKIQWTVYRGDQPSRDTIVHLVDHENNYKREGARTLCGALVGWDSTLGYGAVDCKKCVSAARRRGLEWE